MTTFDINNSKPTKYLEVLESLEQQGHALLATHNPHTWRLSALTFALHLHDCIILFGQLKEKWSMRLPFSEAWDVDFTEWKNRIWSLVYNVSSFTEEPQYNDWQSLCEEDYHTFIEKANDCLLGIIPLKELIDFLAEKNTELKRIIIDTGQDLSMLFANTETMLYESSAALYELFYEDLASIYFRENASPYQIEESGQTITYERWKASKTPKRLPDLILSKIKTANNNMLELKSWNEPWSECFDIEKREIDKEGFARYIFQHRKSIIENNQFPCKNSLTKCFATLCLCEHLWKEHDQLLNPEVNADTDFTSTLPAELATEQAMHYWEKLKQGNFVDEHYMLLESTSRRQAMYIAEPFAEKLGIKAKWSVFEKFWDISNLAQEKNQFQTEGRSPSRSTEIDAIFNE